MPRDTIDAPSYAAKRLYKGETAVTYDAVRTAGGAARRRWNRELALVEEIVRSFPSGARVLDLPCGTGRFHPLLAKYGCEVVGGDISLDMIRQARLAPGRTAESSLVSCDAEQLPFRDRSIDYVLCMRFFNLIPPSTAMAVMREAARISRRGVIIQVRFQGENPLRRLVPDFKRSAGRVLRGLSAGRALSDPRESSPGPGKRFPLPTFAAFADMAREAGLCVSHVHSAGPLLESDPLKMCRLQHRELAADLSTR
jgi:ubiquinone/menaquinone biosynthesis C-methylase UbiE